MTDSTLEMNNDQLEALEPSVDNLPQYECPNTYDPSGNTELDTIRQLLKDRPPSERWLNQIKGAANTKNFPQQLQFATTGNATTYTLQELAETAAHEKATQYIYPDRVKHVLYGPHGIAKGHKLSNDIQLCWRRRLDGELESTPCITSGRHRLTAIILMLQEIGIPWQKQRIIVSTKVVDSDQEFAQLIFDNNDSRKMKQAEKKNHKLGACGVNTASEDAFYNDNQNSVRRARSTSLGPAFAAGCRFRATDKPQPYQDTLYTYATGAFGHLYRCSAENRKFLKALVNGTTPETKDLQQLRDSCYWVANNLMAAIAKSKEQFPTRYENIAAPRSLALMLAEKWNLDAPEWER